MARTREDARGCWVESVLLFLVAVGVCILLVIFAGWVVCRLLEVFLSIWATGVGL